MAKKVGRPREEKPLGVTVSGRVSDELAARLNVYMERHDRAMGWVLRKALEELLDREGIVVGKGAKGDAGGKG